MNRQVLPSLALSWAGSLASWLTTAHPLLSLLATTLAVVASSYAIVVSWRTAKLRRLEIVETSRRLCEQCRAGHPPPECPIPEAERPADCPKNPKPND